MSAAVEFEVAGARCTKAAFLAATAQPGDHYPALIPCEAVAAQGGAA